MSEFDVTFLGTSASVPTSRRNVSSVLIRFNGRRFLVDCGEGAQRQMARFGGLKAPDAIFFTHFHPDHTLGLPGLLSSLALAEHENEVEIFGPEGIPKLTDACRAFGGWPKFAVTNLDSQADFDGFEVRSFKTNHGVSESWGYVFQEPDKPGRFNVEAAHRLGIYPGPNYAALQSGKPVRNGAGQTVFPESVIGPPRKGRKVVISGDTRPCKQTLEAAKNADLLIHEATFTSDQRERAIETHHSTAVEAAMLAKNANVKQLILTHFSPRSDLGQTYREAAEVFPNTVLADDGKIIKL